LSWPKHPDRTKPFGESGLTSPLLFSIVPSQQFSTRTRPMYTASDLRKGLKLLLDKEPYVVTDFQFTKPGKGQALYRCKLRNMISGIMIDRTYRSVDTFEPADLEQRKMQYLYNQESHFYFMDLQNFDQVSLGEAQVGEAKNYLIDNLEVDVLLFEGRPIGITLPNFVDLRVVQADPWAKGDSVAGDSKPVTLETGYILRVPPFVEEGIKITVDTRTGEYVTRVKE
jgi:elongation factor P